MHYTPALLCFAWAIPAITVIDSLGAVASRKLRFNYAFLSILSIAVFMTAGYLLYREYKDIKPVLIVCGILGLYDGTIGFWLSMRLQARTALTEDEEKKVSPTTVITMIVIAMLFGWIGHFLA